MSNPDWNLDLTWKGRSKVTKTMGWVLNIKPRLESGSDMERKIQSHEDNGMGIEYQTQTGIWIWHGKEGPKSQRQWIWHGKDQTWKEGLDGENGILGSPLLSAVRNWMHRGWPASVAGKFPLVPLSWICTCFSQQDGQVRNGGGLQGVCTEAPSSPQSLPLTWHSPNNRICSQMWMLRE